MKRDMDLIRDILLTIEEKCQPMQYFDVMSEEINKGYDCRLIYEHLLLMEEAHLLGNTAKDLCGGFQVQGLSNYGYDFLEKIKNDDVWIQTKNQIDSKKLPKTIEYIAKVAGIFLGNFYGNLNI